MPCYNPPEAWLPKLNDAILEIENKIQPVQFVFVNDGSTSADLPASFKKIKTTLPPVFISYANNTGKGYALRQGVQAATGKLIIYTDIDFPYNTESFFQIFSALQQGADIAVGVRNQTYYAHLSKTRVLVSKLLRWLVKSLFTLPTQDTQCGLKGLNKLGKVVFLSTSIHRYLFDLEFIFLAAKKNLHIKTVPVELKSGIIFTKLKWSILFSESISFIKIFLQSLKKSS